MQGLNDNNDNNKDEVVPEFNGNNFICDFDVCDACDAILKFSIVQNRWKQLCSLESSLRLLDAVKKHVYKKH